MQAELLEARMVNGKPVDVATLCQLASIVMRLSSRLGLERADLDKNRRRRERRNRLEASAVP